MFEEGVENTITEGRSRMTASKISSAISFIQAYLAQVQGYIYRLGILSARYIKVCLHGEFVFFLI